MKIGYACLTVGVRDMNYRTCTKKYATEEKLMEIISHNLSVLERQIHYNRKNQIFMFRISSDIIPFGSSPVNQLDWAAVFEERLRDIGMQALGAGMRLSMHPGQYTVLNSPNEEVVERAVLDLEYHCRFLDALGLDGSHKMILHIGGVYDSKEAAIQRFCDNYRRLSESVKRRLVIENDDRSYTIREVFEIGCQEKIPVVYDILHQQINREPEAEAPVVWLERCRSTWQELDGRQKMHYSQQEPGKRPGSHSETVRIRAFQEFFQDLKASGQDPDVMLEVKDKNLSAVKCILCTAPRPRMSSLESQWAKYKYLVLERSPAVYQEIRQLLKEKEGYPAVAFYEKIESVLHAEPEVGMAVNALQHVWGYFKDAADKREKQSFERSMDKYRKGEMSLRAVKRQLERLAVKYERDYLLDGYYFYET